MELPGELICKLGLDGECLGFVGSLLDRLDTAACLIDAGNRIAGWNAKYAEFFPEHAGLLRPGWDYDDNLRNYFRHNGGIDDPVRFEEVLRAAIHRHRTVREPLLFQKRDGRWLLSQTFWFADGAALKIWTDRSTIMRGQDGVAPGTAGDPWRHGAALFDAEARFVLATSRYGAMFPEAPDLFRPGISYAAHLRGFAISAFAPEEAERIEALARRAHPADLPVEVPMRFRRHDGRWFQMRESVLYDRSVYVVWEDVSDQVALMEDNAALQDMVARQREAQARAEQARRAAEHANRAKSSFLALMSHELRTPLNAVIGFAELLSARPSPEQTQTYAAHILESGRHLLQVINEVLDLSKVEAGSQELRAEPLSAQGMLEEVARLLRGAAAGRQVTFAIAPAPAGLTVLADRLALRKILVNLVGNAVKFSPVGATVRLAAAAEGERVHITVADDGPGIPPDEIETVFEPYRQAGNHYLSQESGSGLGLALVKRLSERLGGRVWATSPPGKGTVMTVDLPRALDR